MRPVRTFGEAVGLALAALGEARGLLTGSDSGPTRLEARDQVELAREALASSSVAIEEFGDRVPRVPLFGPRASVVARIDRLVEDMRREVDPGA